MRAVGAAPAAGSGIDAVTLCERLNAERSCFAVRPGCDGNAPFSAGTVVS